MQHLIIVSHPNAKSFTLAVARAYGEALEQLHQPVETHDLYRMGFDPLLPAAELTGPSTDTMVRNAQEAVRAADVVAFVYPLWWLAMPAMLKGYVDRVFARGFAYDMVNGVMHGLLAPKRAVMITLSGAPMSALIEGGDWDAVRTLQDRHIVRAAGLELVEHLHLDGIGPELMSFAADDLLERVRACARNSCRPSSDLHGFGAKQA